MSKRTPRPVPQFSTPIIETPCPLEYLQAPDRERERAAITAAGIDQIITIAVSPDNLSVVMDLVGRFEAVWGTQGIHPHEADHWHDALRQTISDGARHPKIVGIGEIGLDYHYLHSSRDAQIKAFEEQLALAGELDLPVVIHTREADDDTRAVLANHAGMLRKKGVIHSFTSSLALAEYCLQEGFYLGFNGICTFKNADNVRSVIAATPPEKILLETDAPYLTPVPYRGRSNSPRYLPLVAEKVAEIKNLPVEELLHTARRNSKSLFFEVS